MTTHSMSPDILARRARRALSPAPLPVEDLRLVVEAATLAPSCFNNQPWRIIVVTGEKLEKVKRALSRGNAWAQRAPAIVVLVARRNDDCQLSDGRDYFLFDTGLAAENLMLQATRMWLVAHPIAGFKPDVVRASLAVPAEYVVIALIIMGRPDDDSVPGEAQREHEDAPRQRRPLADVVGWNRFVAPAGE